jgi:hypothetical protein
VDWEDILYSIDVSAEFEVVDFSKIALVEIESNKELEEGFVRRQKT